MIKQLSCRCKRDVAVCKGSWLETSRPFSRAAGDVSLAEQNLDGAQPLATKVSSRQAEILHPCIDVAS